VRPRAAGIVLYDGSAIIPFGDGLHAVPIPRSVGNAVTVAFTESSVTARCSGSQDFVQPIDYVGQILRRSLSDLLAYSVDGQRADLADLDP
jgi:hypothetical protein